jgi:hypothetical protein
MFEKLEGLLRSNSVRLLEEEVWRLRAENCALMNSLFGTAAPPTARRKCTLERPHPFWPPLRPAHGQGQLPRTRASRSLSREVASPLKPAIDQTQQPLLLELPTHAARQFSLREEVCHKSAPQQSNPWRNENQRGRPVRSRPAGATPAPAREKAPLEESMDY